MFLEYLISLLALSTLATTQAVPPDPIFDCSNPNYRVIYTACKAQDYTQCCAVGTDCCAGGCCDLLSTCVGIGTSQETCCNFSDPTNCGTGSSPPTPSVVCTGSDGLSSYKCPPDSTCNDHNDSCFAAAGGGGQSSAAVQSSQAAPSSEAAQSSSEAAAQSSPAVQSFASTSLSGDESSAANSPAVTPSETETATPAGGASSVSVVTVSAAQPTTSTKTGEGASVSVVTVSASPTETSTKTGGASKVATSLSLLGAGGFAVLVAWL